MVTVEVVGACVLIFAVEDRETSEETVLEDGVTVKVLAEDNEDELLLLLSDCELLEMALSDVAALLVALKVLTADDTADVSLALQLIETVAGRLAELDTTVAVVIGAGGTVVVTGSVDVEGLVL